jgi:Protein of unknown function (DUF2934)
VPSGAQNIEFIDIWRFVISSGLPATLQRSNSFGSMKPGELRQRADHYRGLKGRVSDPRALQAISELVDEFEAEAAALEKRGLVRRRAFEIWLQRGCPEGRDVEHWLLAERELAEKDQSTRRI